MTLNSSFIMNNYPMKLANNKTTCSGFLYKEHPLITTFEQSIYHGPGVEIPHELFCSPDKKTHWSKELKITSLVHGRTWTLIQPLKTNKTYHCILYTIWSKRQQHLGGTPKGNSEASIFHTVNPEIFAVY